jgi:hypothetical protein
MNGIRSICLIFSVCSLLIHCSRFSQTEVADDFHSINVSETKQEISLKLSELADSFKLVQLETNEDCLLGEQIQFYTGDKYIIAISETGVFKFSPDGKFVRKLFGVGRGPNEFFALAGFCYFFFDEEFDKIYIQDQMRREHLLVYDMRLDVFLDPIKKRYPRTATFIVIDDSLLLGTNYSFSDTTNCAFYVQDLRTGLVTTVTHDKKCIVKNTELYQASSLHVDGSNYYISFAEDDTLFKIKDNKLHPYLTVKAETNEFKSDDLKGERIIVSYSIKTSENVIIRLRETTKLTRYSIDSYRPEYSYTYIYFDVHDEKTFRIISYHDDFIDEMSEVSKLNLNSEMLRFPSRLPNNKIVVAYSPFKLINKTKQNIPQNDKLSEVRSQLNDMLTNSKETDNPILLIGFI